MEGSYKRIKEGCISQSREFNKEFGRKPISKVTLKRSLCLADVDRNLRCIEESENLKTYCTSLTSLSVNSVLHYCVDSIKKHAFGTFYSKGIRTILHKH